MSMQINPVVISLQKLPDAFSIRCPQAHKNGLDAFGGLHEASQRGRRLSGWPFGVPLQAVITRALVAVRHQGAEYKGIE